MASIVVDNPQNYPAQPTASAGASKEAQLVQWIMSKVDRWRASRDANFVDRWDEYYRLWRGRWHVQDKNRNSERSRLIAPALAEALEMTVAEMVEATFSREQWFDVQDDDKQDQDALTARNQLLYDFKKANVPDKIAEVYLNGALYGTGIAKIVVEKTTQKSIVNGKVQEQPRVLVKVEPIPPSEFIPDPSGRTIDEMLGCAHEVIKPKVYVQQMQTAGVFKKDVVVGGMGEQDATSSNRSDLEQPISVDDAVLITEWHGLVPAKLLPTGQETEMDKMLDQKIEADPTAGDGPLVEAIVTIGNKNILLRAVANPFLMQDRSIVAYQHDKVSGRFHGRGVMEKGYNPEKALNVEMRARADALALISNPMMGGDISRMPNPGDLRVRPGKFWATMGPPAEVLQPVVFAGLDPATFNQSGELAQMVQTGTGAMSSATPISMAAGRGTATASSLMVGAFIKRSKLAMQSVSNNFLAPLVQKAMWRYMQFEPQRYPNDYEFVVIATAGIMAREFEQNQLTQLMGQVPDDQPGPKLLLLKAVVDMSSSTVKNELKQSIDDSVKPDPQKQALQQQVQQLAIQKATLEVEQLSKENRNLDAEYGLLVAKTKHEAIKGDLADDQLTIDTARVMVDREQVKVAQKQADTAARKVEVDAKRPKSKGK